jgi:hypothetical protein
VSSPHENTGLRDDVREAIELSLPDNVVDLTFDPEDSYFWDVQPKLEAAFAKVGNAMLMFERDVQGEDQSWSYFMYFVAPEVDPSDVSDRRSGLAIGVSLLAPFAVITESAIVVVDDEGDVALPYLRTEEGLEPDAALAELRDQVAAILDKHWITALPEEEWRKPVPWLTWSEPGPVRVVDALFFEVFDVDE